MTTQETIKAMFLESTGASLCDSGGTNGRNWQRNQKAGIDALLSEPEVSYNKDLKYYTISTLHYLLAQDFENDDICREFNRINLESDNWDFDGAYGVSKEAGEYLESLNDVEIKDAWNTYNGESALSQVLQGAYVEIDQERYVLIQLHQGCDVRGGYTSARLFKLGNYCDGYLYFEDVYGSITREDGTVVFVDNQYNGYSLTDEDGKDVEIGKNDTVSLELAPR